MEKRDKTNYWLKMDVCFFYFSLFKYSRSEVVLTFFERSPLDQVLKNDNVHKIQPSFQSPVKISGKSC